jgi:hypothetical protein
MHYKAILLGLTAIVPAAWTTTTPSKYFFLQAKSIPGTAGERFNNQYLESSGGTQSPVVLFAGETAASFFTLTNPVPNGNETFYTLKVVRGYAALQTAQMAYNVTESADWQPIFFNDKSSAAGVPSEMENGFYVTGEDGHLHLLWTNNVDEPTKGDFRGWVGKRYSVHLRHRRGLISTLRSLRLVAERAATLLLYKERAQIFEGAMQLRSGQFTAS